MFAYVINHFNDKIKYLEYELYFLFHFRAKTNLDIVYMYSINDTPESFIEIIKRANLNIKFFPYDDKDLTYNVTYKSGYEHFNTLRTCNFVFSLLLTEYEKVCIVESDMFLLANMDDVFECRVPSAKFYGYEKRGNILVHTKKDLCRETPINGGILILKPDKEKFKQLISNLPKIINENCPFPNEALFLFGYKKYYNLPVKYNFSRYFIKHINEYSDIRLLHYDLNIYKPLDSSKENYWPLEKNPLKRKYLKKYQEEVYDVYKERINELLKF